MRVEGAQFFCPPFWENYCRSGRITAFLGESLLFWENHCRSGRIFLPFEPPKRRWNLPLYMFFLCLLSRLHILVTCFSDTWDIGHTFFLCLISRSHIFGHMFFWYLTYRSHVFPIPHFSVTYFGHIFLWSHVFRSHGHTLETIYIVVLLFYYLFIILISSNVIY